eukprot:scaffold4178_cov257-Pinguiococcus_pyrenoidosus.AAC.5
MDATKWVCCMRAHQGSASGALRIRFRASSQSRERQKRRTPQRSGESPQSAFGPPPDPPGHRSRTHTAFSCEGSGGAAR